MTHLPRQLQNILSFVMQTMGVELKVSSALPQSSDCSSLLTINLLLNVDEVHGVGRPVQDIEPSQGAI